MAYTLNDLRRYTVARTLFPPTTLLDAIERLGFVQADPIRAPARAQDLILRHRVRNYRAGDLERRYARLPVEEDFFINYGFLPRAVQVLMHPRAERTPLGARDRRRAAALIAYLRDKGPTHPRHLDQYFAHGTVRNYWGGSSNVTTHLLDTLHYRGQLRVVRRDAGVRIYATHGYGERAHPKQALDALIDLVLQTYAPLPARSLGTLVSRLRYATPQWRAAIPAALGRAKARLSHETIDGVEWFWPAQERIDEWPATNKRRVRLLAPFDPIVWDRPRFELLWRWPYRFEAYTPPAKRKLGYYALPMLRGDVVIGWGNLRVTGSHRLVGRYGYVAGRAPQDMRFKTELAEEVERMRRFLALG